MAEENTGSASQPCCNNKDTSGNGGFHRIAPNAINRQKTLNIAQNETEMYERSKEQSRMKYVSESGAVGGQISEATARNKAQAELFSQRNRIRKAGQKYREEQKRREEEEIQAIKNEARRKAEQLKLNEKKREERHNPDMREKREAFLSRVESLSKELRQMNQDESVLSNSNDSNNKQVSELPTNNSKLTDNKQSAKVENDKLLNEQCQTTYVQSFRSKLTGCTRTTDILAKDDNEKICRLEAMFPEHSRDELIDSFKLCEYDLDQTIAYLIDTST